MTDLATKPAGIRVEGVNLSYGANHVLRNVDLEVRPGELFAFLGPSGCGKTTLLRLIAGFAHADSGRVLVGGEDVSDLPPWKRDIGMVFQNYALWPHMSVAQNVAFGLEERRVPRSEIADRVAAALDLVGLGGLGGRKPSQLSGGQQQRVALARTVVVRPKVLLLDEPLSNLDAKLRVQVRRELRELQQRLGFTTIFVTHDQEEANTICDRIAVMSDGVVQQVGTPVELYDRPANLFVAGFIGTANMLDGRVIDTEGKRAYAYDGLRLRLPPDAVIPAGARLVFRPQNATLHPAGTVPGGAVMHGTVLHREFLGGTVRYGVKVDEAVVSVDMPFQSGAVLFEPGTAVALALDARQALLLTP